MKLTLTFYDLHFAMAMRHSLKRNAHAKENIDLEINFNQDLPTCPDVTLSCSSSSSDICITLQAVDKPQRAPIHCIIVLDISGSMDSLATQPDPSKGEGVRFTRLDLAKHSSKVIVEVMGDSDSVTIISFGSRATVEMEMTAMTAAGTCGLAYKR